MSLPIDETAPVLDLRDVTFRRGDRQILHGIGFAVGRAEHWALLGPNGSGKTTVLGFRGAVTHPTSGTVDVLGHRLGRVELQALRRMIGHVDPPSAAIEVSRHDGRWTARAARRPRDLAATAG